MKFLGELWSILYNVFKRIENKTYIILDLILLNYLGIDGLEPSTSSLSEMRSNQLSYTPLIKLTIIYTLEPSTFPQDCGTL